MSVAPPPDQLRLAATCIPIRSDGDGGVEVLMVQRSPDLSFGNMWTFPGGKLEPGDGELPEPGETDIAWGEPRLLAAAAAGATRETLEETNLECTQAALGWFSHWIPPEASTPKRFATWFFLAPEFRGDPVVATDENIDITWIRPDDALARYARGEFPLVAPTWVTLHDLLTVESIPTLLNNVATQGPRWHHTRSYESGAGANVLCWSGDAAYESGDLDAPGGRNRVLADSVLGMRQLEES